MRTDWASHSSLISLSAAQARNQTQLRLSHQSLPAFVKAVGMPTFRLAPHNVLIMRILMAMRHGLLTRVDFEMPPRHSKTELTSVQFCAWMLALHPWMKIVLASYSRQLAILNSRRIREIFRTPNFAMAFRAVRINEEKSSEAEWETNFGGGVRAVGVGSGLTGFGAHLIVIDDPIKGAEEARSPTVLESVFQWYVTEARTRLQPQENGLKPMILFVATRWAEHDLTGRVLELQEENPDAEKYTRIRLPALAEKNDPLGRPAGEALWPASYPKEALNGIKALDEKGFNALYQQNPRDRAQIHFDTEKIGLGARDVKGWKVCVSWDLAITDDEHSDWCVGALVAGRKVELDEKEAEILKEAGLFHPWELHVMNVWHQVARWPAQRRMIIDVARRLPGVVHVVEKVRMDLAAVQQIQKDLRTIKRKVRTVQPKGDKVSRKANLETVVDLGLLSMADGEWRPDVIKEMRYFPGHQHDDHVDAIEQALTYLSKPEPKSEFI